MIDTSPLIKLQASDHEDILNAIDQLRAEGVSQVISLPQLIMCGDQSSGKSSVLEAISGLGFPARDNVCTRFATELILRRTPVSNVAFSILPDQDRSSADKKRLEAFTTSATSLNQFGDVVSRAGQHIGVENSGYSKDVLRVEVSGPDQLDLTLVDLPGLYHAADETQEEEGIDFVESLVLSYMEDPRSVILAVISAKSDIALQKITKLTRKVDPHGKRTMGIITKPDELDKGSDMERSFLNLAMNQRVYCGLGWHVLKNRSYDERKVSLDERQQLESEFLSSRVWPSLPISQRGITPLRPKLSDILLKHILTELPSLLAEGQKSLLTTQDSLHRLGMSRQSLSDQRHYLLSLSDQFTQLINDAVNGTYIQSFFGDSLDDKHYTKRLRAVVQNRLQAFKDAMTQHGQARQILDDDVETPIDTPYIRRTDYLSEVKERMRRSRGRELPGTFNPLIIGDLFHAQSTPWAEITFRYLDLLLNDVQSCVTLILEEVVDEHSRGRLIKHIFSAAFDRFEEDFRSKTKELLMPQEQGHPITYNSHFIEKVAQARSARTHRSMTDRLKQTYGISRAKHTSKEDFTIQIRDLVEFMEKGAEQDMELYACSEAADHMQAYYEVAMAKFVDDFSNLAAEQHLMQPLLSLFRPHTVVMLSDHVIHEIAKEDEIVHSERLRLTSKADKLQKALTQFHHLERYQSAALRAGKEVNGRVTPTPDADTASICSSSPSPPHISRSEVVEPDPMLEITIPEVVVDKDAAEESDNSLGSLRAFVTKKKLKKHRDAAQWE